MPTSSLGGPELHTDETYPSALLNHLLKQMITQFSAHGACIALYDEHIRQMRIHIHLRLREASTPVLPPNLRPKSLRPVGRRMTVHLENDRLPSSSPLPVPHVPLTDEIDEISPPQSELFAVGTAFSPGQDLIGATWIHNDASLMQQEDYLTTFHQGNPISLQTDATPTMYLSVPIQEVMPINEIHTSGQQAQNVLGIIVLYQVSSLAGPSFQPEQRVEALRYGERVALYLQNDQLQRSQRRTSEYLQHLQEISIAFPTSVKLSDLVENIYQFATQVVNISSLLLTLYDRDTERIYDVFAISNGVRNDTLTEQPVVALKEERKTWWRVTQKEMHTLHFSPAQEPHLTAKHQELLTGTWGDQRQAESFLLLPMKMFNRVIGSLSLTSLYPHAYHPKEIQVLETMAQIITVSIENAKLYERDRQLLHEARQREAQLAALNSALQSISSVLNVTELLNNLVESVATLVQVQMCVFFQLSPTKEDLVAHALYAPTSVNMVDDGSGLPDATLPRSKQGHDELIQTICLPFKNTFLEQLIHEGFFYLDTSKLEELAQRSEAGGAIFLEEMHGQQMLMIPMTYQTDFVGILAVPTPKDSRAFRPKEIGTLLAICAQATSAIRNAQLFEQREEAYAELQRMDKLKDEFLVTASHELRTPLSAVSGYSSLLKRQSGRISPQQTLRFATKIAGAAQQLSDLVTSMTEAANISAVDKNFESQSEPVQVLSAAEIAANMLALSIEPKIFLHVDPGLWVRGYAPRFRQVLTNLLENAAKYSPAESYIQLSALATTLSQIEPLLSEDQIDHELMVNQGNLPVVLVRVQDEGEGILPQDKEKIFEKFVRAPRSLTTPVRGTGLGLYICRRYIDAMGGKIWLEHSEPNEGSIFSFYLPRVEPPVEVREQDAREDQTT